MYKIVNGETVELTGDDLTAAEARIQAEIDAAAAYEAAYGYIALREAAYGKIGDELDMIYRDILNETLDQTGEFYAYVNNVKTTIPKPE